MEHRAHFEVSLRNNCMTIEKLTGKFNKAEILPYMLLICGWMD